MKPKYKSIEHGSTVVVATSIMELAYLLAWCDENNKHYAHFMKEVIDFPYCLSLGTEVIGFTDQMDRALYYKPFSEFLADTTDGESELTRLLATATTAHKDFDIDYQNIIIMIGKGMFWSKEFDIAARELAKRIDEEFEMIMRAGQ